eukprot:745894-Hanusia_phi.AAC.3
MCDQREPFGEVEKKSKKQHREEQEEGRKDREAGAGCVRGRERGIAVVLGGREEVRALCEETGKDCKSTVQAHRRGDAER